MPAQNADKPMLRALGFYNGLQCQTSPNRAVESFLDIFVVANLVCLQGQLRCAAMTSR
jgi:hypothetical protein